MATDCVNCGCNKISCGCKDSFLTTPPPCPTPTDCPDAQPCSETFDSQCVIYTAPDIMCGTDIVVHQDDTVQTALQDIVDYFCTEITIPANIDCAGITIVAQGTHITDAIEDVVNYFCNDIAGGTLVESGSGTTVTSETVGTTTTYTVSVTDSDWVDLEGFDYYTGSMATEKPQCRRIGNTIHFRGTVTIPLSNNGGTTLVPYTANTSYLTQYFNSVYTDYSTSTKGVLVDGSGSITFNRSGLVTADPVIPTSVLDAGVNLDNTYSLGWIIGTRQVQISNTLTNKTSTALSAALNVNITSNKKLVIATLEDLEESTILSTNALYGSSPLRFITSAMSLRSTIPNYLNGPLGTLHSGYASNYQNEGPLVLGRLYTIILHNGTDDFTSSGAESNAQGTSFIYNGVAPLWGDKSELVSGYLGYGSYPNPLSADPGLLNFTTWPFEVDAAKPGQIGGFSFKLDGLIAYLCPCTTNTNVTVDCNTFTCPPNQ